MEGLDDDAAAGRGEIVHHRPLPGVSVALWDVRSTFVRFWSGSVSLQCSEIGGITPGPHSPLGRSVQGLIKTIGRASRKVVHFYVGRHWLALLAHLSRLYFKRRHSTLD